MVAAQTDFNHLIYHRAFPAMAFGMLLICVCAEASVLGVGIVAAGYAFLHLIMCGVCSYLSKQFDLPAPWVISLTTLFFVGGQVIGAGATTLSLWLEAPIGDVAACAIFVLLIGSLGLSGIRNVRFGLGASFVPAPIRVRPRPRNLPCNIWHWTRASHRGRWR